MPSYLHAVPDARDAAGTALLLIDVINPLDFEGGERLLPQALEAAGAIERLRRRARDAGVPVIYVNDNFGRWQSNFEAIIEACLDEGARGRPLAERLRPEEDHYFVLKPRHSAFFRTALDTLLGHLGVRRLVLTGFSGDVCVLMTAMDAYMRGYGLAVPEDAVASVEPAENRHALAYMARVLDADVRPAAGLSFRETEPAAQRR